MGKKYNACFLLFLTGLLFQGVLSHALAGEQIVELKFKGEALSVHLEAVPLKAILERLQKEKGIRFYGGAAVLEEVVSLQFRDLPLEEGLSRILDGLNYIFMYDKEGRLVDVTIVGRSDKKRRIAKNRTADGQSTSLEALTPPAAEPSFEIVPNSPPPGNPNPKPIDMTIMRNYPPPGNPYAKPIDTRVIRNSPPPGNPNAKPIDTTIIKNAPPPGSPDSKSTDPTVIENSP